MKNYQSLYYPEYYTMLSDGNSIKTSRRECFAPPEEPTEDNPFRQRWYYDPEAGYAIRLSRNKMGDDIGKRNAADLKSEERYQVHKSQCVWKNTNKCNQDCDHCNRRENRTVELDKTYTDENNGRISKFDPADESADITTIIEDKALLAALISILDKLSPEDRELWEFLKTKVKKQAIADRYNLTLDGVRYREQRLFAKLRSDKALCDFFEKH
ncbi:MAG: hypothetical protein A2Y17_11360 [Clostridiales bacterium GWF2_38_85]|nr:MAG: hypothetical protein A2Y17_11360 [Clostridiales bacterium GWF2_38_85]HBL84723.1 hypothetical protein [Clostridiales bacterium]